MKLKTSLIIVAALAILCFNVVNAITLYSDAYIYPVDTIKNGETERMIGAVDLEGRNYNNSTNELWTDLKKSVDGTDPVVTHTLLNVGQISTWSYSVSDAVYYISLNPDGPDATGCEGWGKAVNTRP